MNQRCRTCISFRTQVLISSVLDLLYGFVLLGFVIIAFYPALVYIWEVEFYLGYVVPFIFATGTFVLQIILAGVLFQGVRKNKRVWCRAWLLISTLFFILKSITVIAHLATGNHDHDGISYGLFIDCVYKVYQIAAVVGFMTRELHDGQGSGDVVLLGSNEMYKGISRNIEPCLS